MPAQPEHDTDDRAAAQRGEARTVGDDRAAADDRAGGTDRAVRGDGRVEDDAAPDGPRDAAWFERLVHAHATAVHRYVVRRVGASDVEDLTADVLTVAWRRREDVPAGAELPWLYRTVSYVVANHRRKSRPVLVADVPDEADADDPALRAVRDETVRTVLAALSARDREVLLLHAWEGLTGEGLAAALGIGRGGADAALSRARSRLRAAFADAAP
ncbi:RNA polymerase sigma factor [Cellulomonas avistercoris]|uniref:RNA polymerase sigma factor n=1 Tax=Cellulomonas avistercoris TaxID=2762242 RepID=UPI00296AABC8|nr:sigma-70 family RNA polymerase sigma factor [Cellulomonas avistercoris]